MYITTQVVYYFVKGEMLDKSTTGFLY